MNVKLLIVDDEEDIVSSLTRYFRLWDYDVEGTSDPKQALEMIKSENYMLVISDIMMPEMTGIELLKEMKIYNGMIQVIMITGVVKIENILSCLRYGANDCFLKPISDLDILRAAVDGSIERLNRWENLIRSIVKKES